MLRVLAAGLVGGFVLVIWSTLFSVLGPIKSAGEDQSRASSVARSLGGRLSEVLSLGPAAANAATEQPTPAEPAQAPLDLSGAARGLGVACFAGVCAAALMSLYGGPRRSFAERVFFAVLLGAFASAAMMVPDGGWIDFSLADAAPLIGEVLIGWLLAGIVIAMMLNPTLARGRAKAS